MASQWDKELERRYCAKRQIVWYEEKVENKVEKRKEKIEDRRWEMGDR